MSCPVSTIEVCPRFLAAIQKSSCKGFHLCRTQEWFSDSLVVALLQFFSQIKRVLPHEKFFLN
jgi:hypothetical protein